MVSLRLVIAFPLAVVALLMFLQQHSHLKRSESSQKEGQVPVPPPFPEVTGRPIARDPSSVGATMAAIDAALHSRGDVYATYSCKTVSWDDVSRGTVGNQLSVWGANIADTRLWAKSGDQLYTVRSDNWNEKLGRVSADEVALVAGRQGGPLRPVTLRDFLAEIGQYGSYAGLPADLDLSNPKMDAEVSIRFQTTFLPVSNHSLAAIEFAPEMYSYQTFDNSDPRNLLLLATTQGVAVQQDGQGATKLYHHAVGPNGEIHRHWFEAERSSHAVGGQQNESKEEKVLAATRGKATASVIGTRAMGTRFNVLATVQLPLKQSKPAMQASSEVAYMAASSFTMAAPQADEMVAEADASPEASLVKEEASPKANLRLRMRSTATSSATGEANAARVSKGSLVDQWRGLTVTNPQRDDTQHVTVTIVLYNTVAGGVPSEKDVIAAIDDMEALYKSCGWNGKRADSGAAFSTAQLTVKDVLDISAKQSKQPYKAPVEDSGVFPTSRTDY